MEPDAEASGLLELAAALDQRDRSKRARSGGNGDRTSRANVANDVRFDLVLELGGLAAQRRLDLDANHGVGGHDELFESRRGRLGRANGFLDFDGRGRRGWVGGNWRAWQWCWWSRPAARPASIQRRKLGISGGRRLSRLGRLWRRAAARRT